MNFLKIIFAVSIIAVFGFAIPSADALTSQEIQALIAQLQEQIAQLQKQLTETEPQAWCHTFNTNLRIGDVSEEVAALQIALQKAGLIKEEVSGNEFDERIASAIVGFQERYKSEVLAPFKLARGTGFVGSSTRAKLNKLYGCATTSVPPIQTPTPTPIPTPTLVPSITVLSPNGGETWNIGGTYTVKWTSANLQGGEVVAIFLIRDQGTYELAGGSANASDNIKTVTVPVSIPVGSYKIQIVPQGKSIAGWGQSSGYISVVKAAVPSVTVLSPNGGEKWVIRDTHNITWQASGLDKVNILLLSSNDNVTYKVLTLASDINANAGTYSWTVPEKTAVNSLQDSPLLYDYRYHKIEVVDSRYGRPIQVSVKYSDESDSPFSILSSSFYITPWVTVLSPNGEYGFYIGDTVRVRWSTSGISKVRIHVVEKGNLGSGSTNYITPNNESVFASQGYYDWKINTQQLPKGGNGTYIIRIWDADSETYDESDTPFIIKENPALIAPTITSITPASIIQGQTAWVTIYGSNLSGVDIKSGSCGLNASALGGFILGSCSVQPTYISVEITAANEASIGPRQFTITTTSGTSNAVTFTVFAPYSVTSFNYTETDEYNGSVKFSWVNQGTDFVNFWIPCDSRLTIKNAATGGSFACGESDLKLPSNSSLYLQFTNNSGSTINASATVAPITGDATVHNAYSKTINFSIVSVQPSITVLSPNGEYGFYIGDTLRITWSSPGVSRVRIHIVEKGNLGSGSTNYITPNNESVSASQGYYDWKINAQQLPIGGTGQYIIRIIDADSSLFDESNAPFIIKENVTSDRFKQIENQTASISDAISKLLRSLEEFKGSNQ